MEYLSLPMTEKFEKKLSQTSNPGSGITENLPARWAGRFLSFGTALSFILVGSQVSRDGILGSFKS